jgi:hypothetical protein
MPSKRRERSRLPGADLIRRIGVVSAPQFPSPAEIACSTPAIAISQVSLCSPDRN